MHSLRWVALMALSGCIVLTSPGSYEGGETLDAGSPDVFDGGPDANEPDVSSACDIECVDMTPHCDEMRGECVECLGDDHCESADGPICDGGSCTGCRDSAQCTTPEAPVCSLVGADAGECVACTRDADCGGIVSGEDELGVCDDSGALSVCVQCTEATASADCDFRTCNPATQLCTTTGIGEVPDCGRCVGDFDCDFEDGFRCVPMEFQGMPRPDGYCLKPQSRGCSRPYAASLLTARSLSGAVSADYCAIDEATTTCDAVRALRESVSCPGGDASVCADAGALCETVGGSNDRCTYGCGVVAQCPGGITCLGDYCGS